MSVSNMKTSRMTTIQNVLHSSSENIGECELTLNLTITCLEKPCLGIITYLEAQHFIIQNGQKLSYCEDSDSPSSLFFLGI